MFPSTDSLLSLASTLNPRELWSRYRLFAQFPGHKDATLSLALSAHGTLASGGHDGIKLRNVFTKEELVAPCGGQSTRGPIEALQWLTFENEIEILLAGTSAGYMSIWRRPDLASPFEEVAFKNFENMDQIVKLDSSACEKVNCRQVAVIGKNGAVDVWLIDSSGGLENVFRAHAPANFVPIGGNFDIFGQELRVYAIQDGRICTFTSPSGAIKGEPHMNRVVIGFVASSVKDDLIVVDNADDGFDLFSSASWHFIRMFDTGEPETSGPKSVAFGEEGNVVVTGSDQGTVFVFDVNGHKQTICLPFDGCRLVHRVTTGIIRDHAYVVAGGSMPHQRNQILVWRSNFKKKVLPDHQPITTTSSPTWTWWQLIVLVSACYLWWQGLNAAKVHMSNHLEKIWGRGNVDVVRSLLRWLIDVLTRMLE